MTFEQIEKAVTDLYGSWDDFPKGAKDFIVNTLYSGNYEKIYDLVRQNEKDAKADLIDFEGKYPGALKTDNVDDVLQNLRARKLRDDPERY